jgi:plasmid stabilization system protein ParE
MENRPLRWSTRAREENRKLTIYLLGEWGEKIATRVSGLIDKAAQRIHQTPEQFPIFSKHKRVRRCVVSPQTSIFFRVDKEEIIIISIFDNRQSPRKRKL